MYLFASKHLCKLYSFIVIVNNFANFNSTKFCLRIIELWWIRLVCEIFAILDLNDRLFNLALFMNLRNLSKYMHFKLDNFQVLFCKIWTDYFSNYATISSLRTIKKTFYVISPPKITEISPNFNRTVSKIATFDPDTQFLALVLRQISPIIRL